MKWIVAIFLAKSITIAAGLAAIKGDVRVMVAGATGYIGRSVVKQLVGQGIPTGALVRSIESIPSTTGEYLQGAELIQCDVCEEDSVANAYSAFQPTSTICCLASRSGIKSDSYRVDYGGGRNVFLAQERLAEEYYDARSNQKVPKFPWNTELKTAPTSFHYVLLSAYCVGKPLLQFQFAKLKLEEEIQQRIRNRENTSKDNGLIHSIVRPTAYFKSLDGQIENAREGYPILYFGDGQCSANAICENDLAEFLVACATQPKKIDMVNKCRDVGGPDVPPITKKQQIELIFDTLSVPQNKRIALSVPVGLFDFLIFTFTKLEGSSKYLSFNDEGKESLRQQFEDAAEIVRIVRYYATEPMVAIGSGEVQGETTLADHFRKIAARGGVLKEVDKMTTATGVLELFAQNKLYESKSDSATYSAKAASKMGVKRKDSIKHKANSS